MKIDESIKKRLLLGGTHKNSIRLFSETWRFGYAISPFERLPSKDAGVFLARSQGYINLLFLMSV